MASAEVRWAKGAQGDILHLTEGANSLIQLHADVYNAMTQALYKKPECEVVDRSGINWQVIFSSDGQSTYFLPADNIDGDVVCVTTRDLFTKGQVFDGH